MLDHHILLVVVDQCAHRLFVHPGRMHDESMISGTYLVAGTTTFVSYKFLINKDFDPRSYTFKLISLLNADSDYQEYVLLVKIYMSLCSINKSVEVDYYKVRVDGSFHIIIPSNFSKKTSEYLEEITVHHSFTENNGVMMYDDIQVFDLRPHRKF